MTIPKYVTDYLLSNGFIPKINIGRVCIFEKDECTIHIDNVVKRNEIFIRYYKFQPDQQIFSFILPSNKKEFNTVINTLLKVKKRSIMKNRWFPVIGMFTDDFKSINQINIALLLYLYHCVCITIIAILLFY